MVVTLVKKSIQEANFSELIEEDVYKPTMR